MALEKITQVTGKAVHVPGDDIDTDRIIPARFMKCVTFDGLGEYLFNDVRKDENGKEREHNLNDPRFANANIMLSGNNFGCGSSREHAPQSLYRAGFRAVVAEGFAEIFFGNSTNLGMPCVTASKTDIQTIAEAIDKAPDTVVTIDLEKLEITFNDQSIPCAIRDGARNSLINGRWDPIGELLEADAKISELEKSLVY